MNMTNIILLQLTKL